MVVKIETRSLELFGARQSYCWRISATRISELTYQKQCITVEWYSQNKLQEQILSNRTIFYVLHFKNFLETSKIN